MDHTDWVRRELRGLSQSLGFRFTPLKEIEGRLAKVRSGMEKEGLDALLVMKKMNIYYLSGTTQEGVLWVPLEGEPLLMIRRELERARVESPLHGVVTLRSHQDLPALIRNGGRDRFPKTLGLELNVLPVKEYRRLQNLLPDCSLLDGSLILREARKIKSPFEIDLMRVAGKIGENVYREGIKVLKEGMTEIEFGGLLEAAAKRYGHEGLLRMNSFNYEAYSWHVLSGPSGGIVSQSDSPMGGLGLSPAFPVGASRKVMKAH